MRNLNVVADYFRRDDLHGCCDSTRVDLIKHYLVVLVAIQVQRLRWYTVIVRLLAGPRLICPHDMQISLVGGLARHHLTVVLLLVVSFRRLRHNVLRQ